MFKKTITSKCLSLILRVLKPANQVNLFANRNQKVVNKSSWDTQIRNQ